MMFQNRIQTKTVIKYPATFKSDNLHDHQDTSMFIDNPHCHECRRCFGG